ncbi:HesA/MoeB/ThiF family protein [Methanohalophilus halophilus]|uniref:Adenylyltransferase n=1 Tax=Methanohalophilus halophilus TaxID=2177 RepID=A0A1L3Q0A0_9EURY|nr:HesA/MoeB/ThiF family protein [Methanohalophilus halophilus]APH38307.1 adenylyltransferase [Methanohalophilus halophilus]RNI10824.1 HesA/MoeB/ThiF family protein [Methanohalophilus halophilus]SDW01978.1 adenylyltransferase and sulfurtransferase [Methanohalophilus halophilus]
MLTAADKELYGRQVMMIGEDGQEKLKGATVLVAGCGGLGSPVLHYLAVAGIGHIRLIDKDTVELSNLNRQILHWHRDIGKAKSQSAEEKLAELNPNIRLEAFNTEINAENVDELIQGADIIVDALDNYETRMLLNRAAIRQSVPLVHGAVHGFHGQLTTVIPGKTPCIECLIPEKPPKEVFPIIGCTAGVVGTMQANEVIKYLLGEEGLHTGHIVMWDGKNGTLEKMRICRRPDCPECGHL